MKRITLLLMVLMLIGFMGCAKEDLDLDYDSVEVVSFEDGNMMVEFKLNVAYLDDYIESQIVVYEEKLASASEEEKSMIQNIIDNYEANLEKVTTGGEILDVWVFGDFNLWKTALSDVPNAFAPSDENPNIWITEELVPIPYEGKDRIRYKYVINFENYADNMDYVYIEDPLSDDNADDGFGGFNSYFTYVPAEVAEEITEEAIEEVEDEIDEEIEGEEE